MVCQCLGFILLLKWKAAGCLLPITGYQTNPWLCRIALMHGLACWKVTWQPAEDECEGYKYCCRSGLWLRVEETTSPRIFTTPCISLYLEPAICHGLETDRRKPKTFHTDGNLMFRIWTIYKLRLLTPPYIERVSETSFLGSCQLLEHSANEM